MTDATSGSNEGPIDLEALRTRCLGNAVLLERVMQAFKTQLDADMQELQRAFSEGDTTRCARLAHRIKGMAANAAARCLSRHAALAEQCAMEDRVSELSRQLVLVQREYDRVMDLLTPFVTDDVTGCRSPQVSVP